MGASFTLQESSALYGLLAESTNDIILKTDRKGFIVHASPAIERLGLLPSNMLIGPHILDLVDPSCAEAVAAVRLEHDAAIKGRQAGKWLEFPAFTQDDRERWFAIHMRGLVNERGQIYGALSIMRSIEERRNLEDKLFAAAMTDPLTGLSNRQAFIAMLQHLVDKGSGGCLALFDIDRFKSINMQYGQSVGDEVLILFADFLRSLLRSQDIVSRVGSECLGVLLPGARPDQAEAICQRILITLSEVCHTAGSNSFSITASSGVARIGGSLDNTLKRAELALFFAKAKGRNRLEMDGESLVP